MEPARREALDDALRAVRVGRLTRRGFLERALGLGLSAGAIGGLLEACSRRGTIFLVWESEHDAQGVYRPLVDAFNQSNSSGIHVTYLNGPPNSNDLHRKQQDMLTQRSGSTDILSMDVTWPTEYAANGWLFPLEKRWPAGERANYLAVAQQPGLLNGHVWAAPYRMDLGALYYRTDLVSQPPTTWDALSAQAASLAKQHGLPDGFVWAGAVTEGLVCLFSEVLHGFGGDVFRPNDPYTVTLDTPEASAALGQMLGWIGPASPRTVLTYSDDLARRRWQAGQAVFMRNWLSAFPAATDGSAAPVRGKIGIAPLPAGSLGTTGHSCLGGWLLGVNFFSTQPNASWEFISYMLAPSRLMGAARAAGVPVSLAAAYDDPTLAAKQATLARMRPLLATAMQRPISPVYTAVSSSLQARLHETLAGQLTPSEALGALQSHLQALSSRAVPVPTDVPLITPSTI
jgi:multiple sugar transport system substrate-binding protein